jgi:hypothetical protein
MRAYEFLKEELIDEMPLPADWDTSQYGPGTTFKQRLNYALERAKKLGAGSSRVAMIIEYQGRPTVLKVAKNQKGLAQNSVEADILSDGYARQMGILIPIIDYDDQNREPVWIHTEMATRASEKQLCDIMGVENLRQLVNMAWAITGKKKYLGNIQGYEDHLRDLGKTEEDVEMAMDYAGVLADLNMNFDVELGDFTRKANWGIYNGKPVVIDVGFNSNVMQQYYRESEELAKPIKLRGFGPSEKVKEFIAKVYDMYPESPLDPRQRAMTWGEGNDMQFAMFELVPSMSKRDSVEVKWIQAYPLRQGVGGKAMKQLQDLARQAGVGLTLYPWDKGQVKQGNLIKFYKKQGFKPTNKGAKNMYWDPNEGS